MDSFQTKLLTFGLRSEISLVKILTVATRHPMSTSEYGPFTPVTLLLIHVGAIDRPADFYRHRKTMWQTTVNNTR